MANILIVDDEEMILEVVNEYASLAGHTCIEAADGYEALDLVEKNDFDLIILDIMMPRLDGFVTCKKIKEKHDIPVIMLSARQEEYDKLFSFEIGVDDYVTKPFSPKELMARVNVVLGRANKKDNNLLVYEGLEVNASGRTVSIDGQRLNLTPKEIDLLIYLMRNKNVALSRESLLEAVWKYDYYGDDRTVDTHIKMLRRNLGEKYREHIITVRGMGYKFEV